MLRNLLTVTVVAAAVTIGVPRDARPWGSEGHETVGAIADLLLEQHPTTKAKVKGILEKMTLSEVSVFADCAKGFDYCHRDKSDDEKDYVKNNPDHHNYHYTDVPIQQKKYVAGTAGTTKDDVVQVIRYAIKVLKDPNTPKGAAKLTQKQALWVLTHLVGDIHQPLHVGAIYYNDTCKKIVDPNVAGAGQDKFGIGGTVLGTTGGNDLLYTNTENLHHYWDAVVVTGAARLKKLKGPVDPATLAQAIVDHPATGWQSSGDIDEWPAQWATESLLLADDALTEPEFGQAKEKSNGHNVPPTCTASISIDGDYNKEANKVALDQLSKAGFRLAALLVAVFDGQ